jgi:pimeloyl-ACP methyl ester carboxylesterase
VDERKDLVAPVQGGEIRGWITGAGEPVLLLHGGPGMGYEYLDAITEELAGFTVASFQQRGLAPSTTGGPFTARQAVDDVLAVLDALGWQKPVIIGHSWGGHLALRVAALHPGRTRGVLAIDPLGVVGDGGMEAFDDEMDARLPAAVRERAQRIAAREDEGTATLAESTEAVRLYWPAYFAEPAAAPPPGEIRISSEAFAGIMGSLGEEAALVVERLARGEVTYLILSGASSPMPWGASGMASAEISPQGGLEVVQGAGHFLWLEAPGAVQRALGRLLEAAA